MDDYEVHKIEEVSKRLHRHMKEHLPDQLRKEVEFDKNEHERGFEVWMEARRLISPKASSMRSSRMVSTRATSERTSSERVAKTEKYLEGQCTMSESSSSKEKRSELEERLGSSSLSARSMSSRSPSTMCLRGSSMKSLRRDQ